MSSVSFVREVCRMIGAARVTADDLFPMLGSIVNDMGHGMPALFRPREAAFPSGQLIRVWDSDEIASVELTADALETAALAELGPSTGVHSLHGPLQVAISIPQPELARDCTVFAELTPDGARVTKLKLRPDPRV